MAADTYTAQHHRNAFAGYSRHGVDLTTASPQNVVWVHKRHCPDDARSIFPVRRTKPMAHEAPAPCPVPDYWVQEPDAQLGAFSRCSEERVHYRSCQATRCEEWSSVREMLPSSRGFPVRHLQQRWGTVENRPPGYTARRLQKFPHFNNCTTTFVDDMHVSNKHFRLH